ncbi:DegV family protein [Clostridium hydrogeniformans]|uniref:DegV family protein n=1 Tax=Clostridium hydrogeniformans TaxID=349933 RepID=UPI0004841BC8|nr:DegV family protein [Clostridium hydrogeniformans]
MAVKILTDSTSYIPKDILEELDINIVSLKVNFSDESFSEVDINNEEFYEKMKEKGIPKSSQPSIDDLYSSMEKIIKEGNDILCLFLSSKMSGTYSSAHLVKNMMLEDYKDANIEILDSKSNSMELGFISIVAARAAKDGDSLYNVKEKAEDVIRRSRFLFIPENLEYLKKGGRIGTASALVGSLLKIIPILTVEEGVTTVLTKIRTKKKAIEEMIKKVLDDNINFNVEEIAIHHINAVDEAKKLSLKIKEIFNIEARICDIGPVIGLHVGPGAIGIAYYTKKDMKF